MSISSKEGEGVHQAARGRGVSISSKEGERVHQAARGRGLSISSKEGEGVHQSAGEYIKQGRRRSTSYYILMYLN